MHLAPSLSLKSSARALICLLALGMSAACQNQDKSSLHSLPPPAPPITVWADAGPGQKVSDDRVKLDASNSHGDSDEPLTFKWRQLSGPVLNSEQTKSGVRAEFDLPEAGTYVFLLEVSDGKQTAQDEVMVLKASDTPPAFVLHLSVDGLRSDALESLGSEALPHFYRLREEGSTTHDARTDRDSAVTLPNHASQLTGRPVTGEAGHGWEENTYSAGITLHIQKGDYIASVFDVVHDHGLRTAFFSGKDKFQLFLDTYDSKRGAEDTTGQDNGRGKIDRGLLEEDQTQAVDALISVLIGAPHHYTFFHFREPDSTGHASGWDIAAKSSYSTALKRVDSDIGRILTAIESSPILQDRTTIFLTTDHGGTGSGHSDLNLLTNVRIPFYAWGRDVEAGRELYQLNSERRENPGDVLLAAESSAPAIHNAEVANASCRLLGLPTVAGSSINLDSEALILSESP